MNLSDQLKIINPGNEVRSKQVLNDPELEKKKRIDKALLDEYIAKEIENSLINLRWQGSLPNGRMEGILYLKEYSYQRSYDDFGEYYCWEFLPCKNSDIKHMDSKIINNAFGSDKHKVITRASYDATFDKEDARKTFENFGFSNVSVDLQVVRRKSYFLISFVL